MTISLLIVPKEFIHDLYGHEDTRDIPSKDITLTNSHHHCQILNYTTPHYIFQYKISLLSVSFIQRAVLPYRQFSYIIPCHNYFNLRAPPANHSRLYFF